MGKNRAISSNFGSLLKYYREQRKLSLKEMEELTGVSAGYVCRLENGERKAPSIPIIQLLASALDIPVSELIDASKENENEDINSVSKLLIINDFTVNGKVIEKIPKQLLVSIIECITNFKWEENTRLKDSFEILGLIEEFNKELIG